MSVEALVSRSYQEELAARAREHNAILAMDTGTGKTMISAMVIRWRLAQERMNRGNDRSPATKRVAVFLVPKVPLVEQQRSFLSQNMEFETRGYIGSMGVDGWDRIAWQKEFMEADVLVMTSQIFLNILRHVHWTMRQISIIVFDEVHNCRGRSPESLIMAEHYHTLDSNSTKPKILGLTASPIFNVKQPVTALKQIEKLTDCTVYVVKEHAEQLAQFSFQAEDCIVDYPPTPTIFPLYDSSLWVELHTKTLLPNDLLFRTRVVYSSDFQSHQGQWYRTFQTRYFSTLSSLGPFAADVFVFVHMTTALEALKQDLSAVLPNIKDVDEIPRRSINNTLAVLATHQARLATEGATLPNEWLSPKLTLLKKLLLEQEWEGFRGIIFTNERQVATTLALILPRLGISGIAAGPLVGHGHNICSEPTKIGMKGMSFRAQEHILADFRRGTLNMLIATSVAEEGLDFPQCSFVCRFDPPRTLPQYIQSRGRARVAKSSFIIMLESGPSLDRGRVEALRMGETRVKHLYGKNMDRTDDEASDIDSEEEIDPLSEGRFVVPSTGASLTPAGAISLLNNVCSLIRRDPHTPLLRPKYNDHSALHTCEVRLPAALPIPRDSLVIIGNPFSLSKKAAKRSAAFNAVIKLHELGVFDEYLLPIRRGKGDTAEDVDGKPPVDVSSIEPLMEVLVHDPWGNVWEQGAPMYLHVLNVAGRQGMGLVCANRFSHFQGEMIASRQKVSLNVSEGTLVEMDEEAKGGALELMDKYTKHGIRHAVTGKGLRKPLCVFLVPIGKSGQPDWDEMEHAIHTPASRDWRGFKADDSTELLISLVNHTKVHKLIGIRHDLKAADCVSTNITLTKLVASLAKFGQHLPEEDLVLQCRQVLPTTSTEFRDASRQKSALLDDQDMFFPRSLCQWINFPQEVMQWFLLLPPLTNFLTSVFRARTFQKRMNTHSLDLNRTIEAFTLPSAGASFNNQRLETLGDAFLKLATSVHVFNKHIYKHEGQLSVLRQNSVCNRYLLGRGHVQNLESFMNNEINTQRIWRLTTSDRVSVGGTWFVKRMIPRRSVQDCMEALLGAAWVSGGVAGGLEVGTQLDLCFGGKQVWWERYPHKEPNADVASPFPSLEEALGYEFKDKSLLIEALTHPSFTGAGASYQRLEFLGDAILDLVAMDHLFKKYPTARSGKLTRARARYVRNPTLSAVGTKKLHIHKLILCDVFSLQDAINQTATEYDEMSFEQIIEDLWKLDAPKAIGDVVEALLGAVFVDSGWNYEAANRVTLHLLEEVLQLVHPDMPSDPTTEFLLWVGRYGCTQVKYRRDASSNEPYRKNQIFVVVHNVDIGAPAYIKPKTSPVLARAMVSLSAKALLEDPMSQFYFDKVCSCSRKEKAEKVKLYAVAADLATDENDLNVETAEGFATSAQNECIRLGDDASSGTGEEDAEDISEGEEDKEDSEGIGGGMDVDSGDEILI